MAMAQTTAQIWKERESVCTEEEDGLEKKQQQRKSEHYYRREKKKICNKKASGAHTALQMIENEARAKKEINAHSNIVSFCPEPFARIQNVQMCSFGWYVSLYASSNDIYTKWQCEYGHIFRMRFFFFCSARFTLSLQFYFVFFFFFFLFA